MVEVFASNKSRVGERVNFRSALNGEVLRIEEISNVRVLKEMYDEMIDFTSKLVDANKTMEEYKDDRDILEAIEENEKIIERRMKTIETIEKRFYALEREDLISRDNKLTNKNVDVYR